MFLTCFEFRFRDLHELLLELYLPNSLFEDVLKSLDVISEYQ